MTNVPAGVGFGLQDAFSNPSDLGTARSSSHILADVFGQLNRADRTQLTQLLGVIGALTHDEAEEARTQLGNMAQKEGGELQLPQGNADPSRHFANPNISLEDALALFLFDVMTAMDNRIKDPSQKMIDAQAGKGTSGDGDHSSIDVDVMTLQRLVDSRHQMFEMVSNILKPWDSTADDVIQSFGQ